MNWKTRLTDIVASLVFMGAMWQLEIADLNLINNGVPFGYAFTWIIIEDNWAVRDFWMMLMIVAFIVVGLNGRTAIPNRKEQKYCSSKCSAKHKGYLNLPQYQPVLTQHASRNQPIK